MRILVSIRGTGKGGSSMAASGAPQSFCRELQVDQANPLAVTGLRI